MAHSLLPAPSFTVNRMGYGAMQLAGPHVFGPPKDRPAALAVLREAVATGINHIDTSDFYGPHVTNQIIKEALHPYKDGLVIVTKVGARRGDDGSWIMDCSRQGLIDGVNDNLRNLSARCARRGKPACGWSYSADRRLHRRTLHRPGGTPTPGPHPPPRPLERHPHAACRGSEDRPRRLHPELLQHREPRRRQLYRLTRRAGHRLRPVLPARRLHTSPVDHRSRQPQRRSAPHPCRSRWHGCCSVLPTSFLSRAPRRSLISARTWLPQAFS